AACGGRHSRADVDARWDRAGCLQYATDRVQEIAFPLVTGVYSSLYRSVGRSELANLDPTAGGMSARGATRYSRAPSRQPYDATASSSPHVMASAARAALSAQAGRPTRDPRENSRASGQQWVGGRGVAESTPGRGHHDGGGWQLRGSHGRRP